MEDLEIPDEVRNRLGAARRAVVFSGADERSMKEVGEIGGPFSVLYRGTCSFRADEERVMEDLEIPDEVRGRSVVDGPLARDHAPRAA